jgi:hypothetical protein
MADELKTITPAMERELWVKCRVTPYRKPELPKNQAYTGSNWEYPPLDLNNLEKYAWPVAVDKEVENYKRNRPLPEIGIEHIPLTRENLDYIARHRILKKLESKMAEGYSLRDSLFWVCYEVLCGK